MAGIKRTKEQRQARKQLKASLDAQGASPYQIRIALAQAEGQTRAEARGHGGLRERRERATRPYKPPTALNARELQALDLVYQGASFTDAAKLAHVAPETLTRKARARDLLDEGRGGRLKAHGYYRHTVLTTDGERTVYVDYRNKQEIASWLGTTKNLYGNLPRNKRALESLKDRTVTDLMGQTYQLEYRPNLLRNWLTPPKTQQIGEEFDYPV